MGAWAVADDFLRRIIALSDSGFGLIEGEVFGLTAILIAITFGILGFKFILAGEDAKSILVQFFFKVLFVGFMVWIIKAWPTLYHQIGEYFQNVGGVAGGVADAGEMLQRPSRIMESLDLAKAPIERRIDELTGGIGGAIWNSGKAFSLYFSLMWIELAFFVTFLNMFFTVVEFHLISLAAWPFLAFSVFKGSTFLAERPIGYVFAIGAKLFIMTMILGFSLNFFDSTILPAEPTINQSLTTAMMSFIIMVLAVLVPAVAAGLISGGPVLSAAIPMMTTAGAAMAMTSAVSSIKAAATSGPVRAVGSATATAAQRAAGSVGKAFSPAASTAAAAARSAASAATGTASAAGGAAQRGAGAAASMRATSSARRPQGGGQRGDFLQRVRNAIPPGTDGHASGNAPRLSDEM